MNSVPAKQRILSLLIHLLLGLFSSLAASGSENSNEMQLCGQLIPHKQKWFSNHSMIILSSRRAINLRECITACCSIPDCSAVTFTGFLAKTREVANGSASRTTTTLGSSSPSTPTPASDNCLMFKCNVNGGESCSLTEEKIARGGVISVQILRRLSQEEAVQATTTTATPLISTSTTAPAQESSPTTHISNGNNELLIEPFGRILPVGHTEAASVAEEEKIRGPSEAQGASPTTEIPPEKTTDSGFHLRAELAPIWAIGLAIVVAIVCVGMNVALLGAYCCYKRQRARIQEAELKRSSAMLKTPTLHAFNPPTPPHIQHPYRLNG